LPENSVERVDAIVLAGGSAFGLSAAEGVMQWLAAEGRGFAVGNVRVPIVPAACLFDLANGGDKSALTAGGQLVYASLGVAACAAASTDTEMGSVGAGTGATTAGLKGGFGAAETSLADGTKLAAFVAVNAVGRVTLGNSPYFRAAPFELAAEFGGLGLRSPLPTDVADPVMKAHARERSSTTLAVVATDCALTRAAAKRIAIAAHDGIALAIYPAHTPLDGDAVFVLATGARQSLIKSPIDLAPLCAAAVSTLARAVALAVYAATPAPGDPVSTWRERYGDALKSDAR
jgi:L-aminopeptidase/D-esterase-like protein